MPKRKTMDKEYQDLTKDIDVLVLKENIRVFFSQFPDPRMQNRCTYPVWYIVLVILCGYLSGCNTITDMAHFAEARNTWLNSLLGLNFKPISYDTIWWFLVRVSPDAFKTLMSEWLEALPSDIKERFFAIDGKRLRGVSDKEHISHLVELFAVGPRLMIAQERVPNKSCERKALPLLLKGIDVRGAVISMDAHYTYIESLQLIIDAGADYILGIKGNQGTLKAEVSKYFTQAQAIGYNDEEFKYCQTIDKGHGRIETRHICVSNHVEWISKFQEWGFKSLVEIRSERIINNKSEKGVLYYGSSREATPQQFAQWIRNHWLIENACHWVLDVVFREDASLANTGHAAENMGLLRRIVMNIIKTFDPQRGLADARRNATYEPSYLRGILSRLFARKC